MHPFTKPYKQNTMNKKHTIYHLIVDRSSSMGDCIEATINGFNEQLNSIHSLEAEYPEQEIRIGLTLFNDRVDLIRTTDPVASMTPMNRQNYVPAGGTALLDAIGKTVSHLQEWQRRNHLTDSTFVVVILTDGYENSSRFFNLEQIRSLIREMEASGKWTFSFIGATLDAIDVAAQMAIRAENSFSFQKSSMKDEVWDKLSGSMDRYMDKKRYGKDLSNFLDEEK